MKKKSIFIAVLILLLQCIGMHLSAQRINLDKPIKAGELTVFPDIENERNYYYISDKPRLATDANGRPQFSFLRYVDNATPAGDQAGRTEGEGTGGGIVHAVVTLEVTRDQIREAQRALQSIRPDAVIQGPVVYKSGRFGIISAVKDAQGGLSRQVVGLGTAPILDGQKAAVSIQLTKEGAKILWESFKTTTPDISFTFEMEVSGYRSPKNAVIEANFDQIYNHTAFNAGVATQFLAAEIRTAFDDLVRSGAIKVTQIGEDEKMEALITTAYNKISDMMFSPLNGTGNPSLSDLGNATGSSSSMLDRATTMLRQNRQEARDINRENDERRRNATATREAAGLPADARTGGADTDYEPPSTARAGIRPPTVGSAGSGNNNNNNQQESMPSIAIVASFEMKRIRQQGMFRIDLNKSSADRISMRFDENIGNLSSYMGDNNMFREMNMDDPLFVQREIIAFIDGVNAQDFGQYINFVNVRLKKTHQSGEVSNREVRIDRTNFNREGNNFKMVYGYKGDRDRQRWFDYEYEVEWSFFGGQTVPVPLQRSRGGAINLNPPFQKRTVEFQADQARLAEANVRLITVKLIYTLNGRELSKVVTLNPARNQLSERVEFMLPADSYNFQYEVTWKLANNTTRTSGRQNGDDAIVFVDNITI